MIGPKTRTAAAAVLLAATLGISASAHEGGHEAPPIARQKWTFSGMLGSFDAAQLQRGFKVYTEVCARCHGVQRLSFRNLVQPGGPEFPEAAVKSLAADKFKVDAEPNDQGKVLKRPAVLADRIPSPYRNEQEARASQPGGALPPDLSLITKARSIETHAPFYMVPLNMMRDILAGYQEAGADYLYAFLMGFKEPGKDVKVPDGMNYNEAFPAPHFTSMPNPFAAGNDTVKYEDGTPQTVDNFARDVTAFLAWAGDPSLADRKRLGLLVTVYLLITAILLYFAKRRIWSKVH